MKKVTFVTAVALGCGIAVGTGRVVGIALPGEAIARARNRATPRSSSTG